MDSDKIPNNNKLYYSIGEVKDITGIEPHVLRYWESEFATFRPRKTRTGQRAYTKKDIEMILNIKKLLYEEKFTIKGARNKLKTPLTDSSPTPPGPNPKKASHADDSDNQLVFNEIEDEAKAQISDKSFLLEIRAQLMEISQEIKKMI